MSVTKASNPDAHLTESPFPPLFPAFDLHVLIMRGGNRTFGYFVFLHF